MKTIVITGGTDGMGAALARHYLRNGDQVVVVGRSQEKFDRLIATLAVDRPPSLAKRAHFIEADLSLIADSKRVLRQLVERYDHIDALVLAASFIRQQRHLTAEGHEASWILFFVSRYILATGLARQLAGAERPVIINVSVPGAKAGALNFDDLELARSFSFARSNAQQRRANELLGIIAIRESKISYATWGPKGLVKTSFAGEVGPLMKYTASLLSPIIGQDPGEAVLSIIALLADPPPGRTAWRGSKPTSLRETLADDRDAIRLAAAVGDVVGED